MDKYRDVKSRLVLTDHGKDNLHTRRKDIPIHKVVCAVAYAKIKDFAGHKRYRVTYGDVTVVYKIDETNPNRPLFVVITYYRVGKSSCRKKKKYKLS